ncbi:M50 family metallopeptidase [Alicyclobacillus sp.]|uniref:M50 family metallopeptidase n=1 Tax=Alicyclobacillus sp. TaxID=61169 RepID=UPI0025BA49FD|nr:M50 family metallopeptidase [Alicyclobacillus sp.]MCL6516161.1 M50 family metallopeptidase [Alicyclobacillus sp.]
MSLPRGAGVWRRVRAARGLAARIRIHPLFLALAAGAVYAGLWQDLLVLFALVMLHELGHAATAEALGYEVEEITLLPFGGVAKLGRGGLGFEPRHEALIAVAGPAVNLALLACAAGMHALGLWSDGYFHRVSQWNLWIVTFNLLPGLPLDGGRILRAARSRVLGYEAATREAYHMALGLAVMLFLLGAAALWAGYPHLGMLVLGLFLFVTAWAGRRDLSMETIRFLDAKRRQVHGRPEVIRSLVVSRGTSIRDVVRRFAPDRYHLIYVRDDHGAVSAVVEEDELLQAVFEGRWLEPVGDWLDRT